MPLINYQIVVNSAFVLELRLQVYLLYSHLKAACDTHTLLYLGREK